MFSGIIESLGKVVSIRQDRDNYHFFISCPFISELKPDQSLAHNGVCLTIVNVKDGLYSVTAVAETMARTNLGELKEGDEVNLERCLKVGDRIDGHIVQGHVDGTGTCEKIEALEGSHKFWVRYVLPDHLTVEKGSICVNGVSLTVVDSQPGLFSVVIIPYTFDHTTFKNLKKGDKVNLEFDILGKYVLEYLRNRK